METKITWTDNLNLNFVVIDSHHKKLVSMINKYGDLLSAPHKTYKNEVGKVLKSLIDYTIYHFSEEEKIMKKYNYTNLAEHKDIHDAFVKKLKDSLIPLLEGDLQKGAEFYAFLCTWLLNHIAKTDKEWALQIDKNFPEAKNMV